jgi:hypothetical protein
MVGEKLLSTKDNFAEIISKAMDEVNVLKIRLAIIKVIGRMIYRTDSE